MSTNVGALMGPTSLKPNGALAVDSSNCGVVAASSARMVPVAVSVPSVAPPVGFESDTVNTSFDSTRKSPATLMLMVFSLSPSAKLTCPVGSTPPTKSDASSPVLPVTAKSTVASPEVLTVRVTVKVNATVPLLPSLLLDGASAAIDRTPGIETSSVVTKAAERVPNTGLESLKFLRPAGVPGGSIFYSLAVSRNIGGRSRTVRS